MRWLPEWALPARAFLPGRGTRRPEVGGPEPRDRPWDEWYFDEAYLYGVDLYDGGFEWEAHEVWEGSWKLASDPARREFLQGLIQCAAAAVKARAGVPSGATSLATRAAGRLDAAARLAGEPLLGLDPTVLARQLRAWVASGRPAPAARPVLALRVRSRDMPASLSDLRVRAAETQIEPGDGFLAVRTPTQPGFCDGNTLLLDARPADIEARLRDCRAAVGEHPERPLSLCWEVGLEASQPAPDEAEALAVLLAHRPPGQRSAPAGVTLWPMDARQSEALVELALAVNGAGEPRRASFCRWRTTSLFRSLAERGGSFWGAFRGEHLVGSLALYESPTLFRFQEVITCPGERGRGVATSLAARALREAFTRHPRATAVIVADAGSQAARIYERLGFRAAGYQYWLRRSA